MEARDTKVCARMPNAKIHGCNACKKCKKDLRMTFRKLKDLYAGFEKVKDLNARILKT